MSEFRVNMVVEGRNTQVTITASNSAYARQQALAQYAGSKARVLSVEQVRK
jgi:hypothetical protein